MHFDKLLKLAGRLDEEGKELFAASISSFFGETLFPDTFPFEDKKFDLRAFKEDVGENIFRPFFMSAVEFFLSNEYINDFDSWNAIDFILKKRAALLPTQDKIYLKGLKNSYMSIYEVIDVKFDQSITVRNLLEDAPTPIIVKEKQGTHYICQWDLLGARLVTTPQATLFAGGLFILEREAANAAKEVIQNISKIMMSKENLRLFEKDTKDPVLMIKKMWAKEIVQNWFMEEMAKKEGPTFLNYDGDRLEFYTIEFPLKVSTQEVTKKLNTFPELVPHDIEDTPHAWIWPLEEKKEKGRPLQKKIEKKKGKEIRIDSQLSDQDGSICRYLAEIKIMKKTLIIDVNSEKRADRMEDFFQTQLRTLIGNPTRIKHDLERLSEQTDSREKPFSGIPKEEEERLIRQMLDKHYREWLDDPLPFLNQKTPRQAAKTKKGLPTVIDLLKDMENLEIRAVKQGNRATAYNFDWMFSELGIEKDRL